MSVIYASGKWVNLETQTLLSKGMKARGVPAPTFVDAHTERAKESDNTIIQLLPAFPPKRCSVLVIMTGKHSLSFKIFDVTNREIVRSNSVCVHPHYFDDQAHASLLQITLKKELNDWKEESGIKQIDWVIASGAMWHYMKKKNFPVLPEGKNIRTKDAYGQSILYGDAPAIGQAAMHLPWLSELVNGAKPEPKFTCFRWLQLSIPNGGFGCYAAVTNELVKPLYFTLSPKTFTIDIGTGSVKFYYDMNPEAVETHAADIHPETMAYVVATTLLKLENLKRENKL